MKSFVVTISLLTMLTGATLAQEPWKEPPPTPGAIARHPATFKQDSIEIKLGPKEGMEYKYRLDKGAAFLYSWTSTGTVTSEMHSVPDGAPKEFAEFFDKGSSDRGHGSYVAPWPGIHGWWFENTSDQAVTITFTSQGFYTESHEFRRATPVKIKKF